MPGLMPNGIANVADDVFSRRISSIPARRQRFLTGGFGLIRSVGIRSRKLCTNN